MKNIENTQSLFVFQILGKLVQNPVVAALICEACVVTSQVRVDYLHLHQQQVS